jgi:CO/xanthine dehydrogenase FAD-binding subunit
MPNYARPDRLDAALKMLSGGKASVLAGGTDWYPARLGRPLTEDVVDLGAIAGLRGISEQDDHWRVGATSTWTDIIEARLPPYFDALKLAAREVGGEQVQNTGTLAGNLCNASPAADGAPALLALDASVELAALTGTRRLALPRFLLGPRRTALAAGELLTAILIPKPAHPAKSHFIKLGARKYLLISIAMAAAAVETRKGSITAARIAVGSCSPVAMRLPALEAALAGRALDAGIADAVKPEHLAALNPIADVRASAEYRREAALELVKRVLRELA